MNTPKKALNTRTRKSLTSMFFIQFFLVTNFILAGVTSVYASYLLTQDVRLLGGALDDEVTAIVQADDGGYAIAGTTSSYGAGKADFWLIKIDADGNIEWNQTYGGSEMDEATAMTKTNDGGYALAGETNSFGTDNKDFWLVKVDSTGKIQWNQTYGKTIADGANSVIQTSDGGFALVGYSTDDTANYDFFFVKTDLWGNLQWNRTYGGDGSDVANSIIETCDKGYVIVGSSNSFTNVWSDDCWVIKTNENGVIEWDKTFDGSDGSMDDAVAVIQTNDNEYVFAGKTGGFIGQNVWISKIDSIGTILWNVIWDVNDPAQTSNIVQTNDNGLLISGYTSNLDGIGNFDSYWFLVKVDTNGNIQWNSTFNGLGDNKAFFAIETGNNGYAFVGSTRSTDEGATYDVWFAKTDKDGNIIPEFPLWVILPLFLAVTLVAVIIKNNLFVLAQK